MNTFMPFPGFLPGMNNGNQEQRVQKLESSVEGIQKQIEQQKDSFAISQKEICKKMAGQKQVLEKTFDKNLRESEERMNLQQKRQLQLHETSMKDATRRGFNTLKADIRSNQDQINESARKFDSFKRAFNTRADSMESELTHCSKQIKGLGERVDQNAEANKNALQGIRN